MLRILAAKIEAIPTVDLTNALPATIEGDLSVSITAAGKDSIYADASVFKVTANTTDVTCSY